MEDLRHLAAVDFVVPDLYAQYPADGEIATFAAATYANSRELRPADRRKCMEQRLVYSTHHDTAQDPDLVDKLAAWGLHCTKELLTNLHAAYDSMPTKLKPFY